MSLGHRNLHTVCERHDWRCYYCERPIRCGTCHPHGRNRIATRDHFVPKARGGRTGPNLVAACLQCNRQKADGEPGSKPPKARSLGGCHYARPARQARHRRPRTAYPSLPIAVSMAAAVEMETGKRLVPWLCPKCEKYHLNKPEHIPDGGSAVLALEASR